MAETQFTPGPWIYERRDGSRHIDSSDGQLSICDEQYYPWIDCADDDWYLIAAAPQMYAALKEIQDFCDDPNGSDRNETLALGLARLLPAARAALVKAVSQ